MAKQWQALLTTKAAMKPPPTLLNRLLEVVQSLKPIPVFRGAVQLYTGFSKLQMHTPRDEFP